MKEVARCQDYFKKGLRISDFVLDLRMCIDKTKAISLTHT